MNERHIWVPIVLSLWHQTYIERAYDPIALGWEKAQGPYADPAGTMATGSGRDAAGGDLGRSLYRVTFDVRQVHRHPRVESTK